MRAAADALSFAISNGVQDADYILVSYRTLASQVQQIQPMQLKNNIIQIPVFHTDNNKYDNLFKKQIYSR